MGGVYPATNRYGNMTAGNRNVKKWKAAYTRAINGGKTPDRASEMADVALGWKPTAQTQAVSKSSATRDWSREMAAARRALARSAAQIEKRHRRKKVEAFGSGAGDRQQ